MHLELRFDIRLSTAQIFEYESLGQLITLFVEDELGGMPLEPGRSSSRKRISWRSLVVGLYRLLPSSDWLSDRAGSATAQEIEAMDRSWVFRHLPFSQEVGITSKRLQNSFISKHAWTKEHIAEDALIFKCQETLEASPLVILFGGNRRRPMMPISLFLGSLSGIADTVILLRSETNEGFRTGIKGLGADLDSAFNNLAKTTQELLQKRSESGQVLIVGTSGGGLPAFIFASLLQPSRVVMVGPNSSRDPRWGNNASLKAALDLNNRGSMGPVTICWGLQSQQDTKAIQELQQDILDPQLFPVEGAGHNPLWLFLERGELNQRIRGWLD